MVRLEARSNVLITAAQSRSRDECEGTRGGMEYVIVESSIEMKAVSVSLNIL